MPIFRWLLVVGFSENIPAWGEYRNGMTLACINKRHVDFHHAFVLQVSDDFGTWQITHRFLDVLFSIPEAGSEDLKRLVLFCSLLRSRHAFHHQQFCCQLIPTSHHIPSNFLELFPYRSEFGTEVQPSQQDHHLRLSLPHRLGLTELGREAWCLELSGTGMQLDKSWISWITRHQYAVIAPF